MIATHDLGSIKRAVETAHSAVSGRTGLVKAVINTDQIDRMNTVILPDGVDTAAYEALGRPICFEHGQHSRGLLPVGYCERCEKVPYQGRRAIVIEARFLGDDEFSRQLGERYRSGAMRGWSIQAKPVPGTAGRPTAAELQTHPEWAGCSAVFRRTELLEISCVTVPGNASTVTTEVLRSGSGGALSAGPAAGIRAEFAAGARAINAALERRVSYFGELFEQLREQDKP